MQCDRHIERGCSVLFLWDRTFCSDVCRMKHLERACVPAIHTQYMSLSPSSWEKQCAKRDQEIISFRKNTTKAVEVVASFGWVQLALGAAQAAASMFQ